MRWIIALLGLGLLAKAIELGLSGSWPLAVFFFVLFGGVECFVFLVMPQAFNRDREKS